MHALPKRAVLGLVCVLTAAGCSHSNDGAPSRSTVADVGLQLSDFPPTWRRFEKPVPDVLAKLAACTGADLHQAGNTRETIGSGVFRNDHRTIWSVTTGYPSQRGVADRAAAIGSSRADACMASVMRPTIADVVPGSRTISSHFTAEPGGVNTAAAVVGTAKGSVTVAKDGRRAIVHVDVTFIGGADLASVLVFIGVGKPVPERIQSVLVFRVSGRALGD